jgi:hypothetical protein
VPPERVEAGEVQTEQFKRPYVSVDRAALKSLDDFRSEHAGRFVAVLSAAKCFELGHVILPDPLEHNPAHANVVIAHSGTSDLRRKARELRKLRSCVYTRRSPL